MKPTLANCTRRKRNVSRENFSFKKGESENHFFGETFATNFFQSSAHIANRKCETYEADDKKLMKKESGYTSTSINR